MYAPTRLGTRLRRSALALGALLVAVLAAGCSGSVAGPGLQPDSSGVPTATAVPGQPAEESISLSATGDIIMGNAPNRLPANGGKGFFDSVEKALAADLVMGNLEELLTVDTGTGKCGANSTRCFQFRAPPEYAAHLRDAGFDLLNQANNHGYDYGPKGYENTEKALERYDLAHTGAPDQITVVEVEGVKVAVAGFSSYVWSNSLIDIAAAKKVITKAAGM
ncbi:CapA family protein, partial [Micromonospora sp. NPDC047707]|uniref:CapA family protein n=1 Tax=Micromonospora sp. NPDC047707 TaxID=3154498 RepID=UPI003453C3FF